MRKWWCREHGLQRIRGPLSWIRRVYAHLDTTMANPDSCAQLHSPPGTFVFSIVRGNCSAPASVLDRMLVPVNDMSTCEESPFATGVGRGRHSSEVGGLGARRPRNQLIISLTFEAARLAIRPWSSLYGAFLVHTISCHRSTLVWSA